MPFRGVPHRIDRNRPPGALADKSPAGIYGSFKPAIRHQVALHRNGIIHHGRIGEVDGVSIPCHGYAGIVGNV